MRVSLADPQPPAAFVSPPSPSLRDAATAGGADAAFTQALDGVGRELARGEATTRSAIASIGAGAPMEPGQLIALQTGVYRYSEAIDLASRLVDRVTGGVKTVLQGTGQ
jgi:hypothetical protein